MPRKTANNKTIFQRFTFQKLNRQQILIILGLLAILTALFFGKSIFVAAIVNNQLISRLSLIRELEKQSGQQALESLVTQTLILQEAKKQKITIRQEEINAEIAKFEKNFADQGQKLDDLLQAQGMTRQTLTEQIKMQKLVERLAGKDLIIKNEEIDAFLKENKNLIPKELSAEKARQQAEEQLRSQKLTEAVQTWLDGLRRNAKISYWLRF